MSLPNIRTLPVQRSARPERTSISVDLPAPFGPITPRISPAATLMPTPFSAKNPPNDRVMSMPSSAQASAIGLAPRPQLRQRTAESRRRHQHHRDEDKANDGLPMLGDVAGQVLGEEIDDGAQSRSPDHSRAADDRHDQRGAGQAPVQDAGGNKDVVECEQDAGDGDDER